jgi:hypothetical protein
MKRPEGLNSSTAFPRRNLTYTPRHLPLAQVPGSVGTVRLVAQDLGQK